MFSFPGCTTSIFPLGFRLELDGVILALASALSHACEPPARAGSKVKGPQATEPTCVYKAAIFEPWGFLGIHWAHRHVCMYLQPHICTRSHICTCCTHILHTQATYTHSYMLVCTYRYSQVLNHARTHLHSHTYICTYIT